ncbi:phosphatidylserine decarboxylase [Ectothiorhodospiraceae bacterium 2226]|nr:phosphatidylserine decarboxylase [Ectothiorhodospiraceae bacterium 2226]
MAASWLDRVLTLPQYALPHHALSLLAHRLTRLRRPAALKNAMIRAFIRAYGVDMNLAAEPTPEAYPDFNSFFTRPLVPGARPIAEPPEGIVSPADGAFSQLGSIAGDQIFQAKGHQYTLQALLGGGAADAAPFLGGQFATIYLSPKDYHRVHMPCAGTLRSMLHVPGRLFSVNSRTARVVPGLFARNERVVALFDTEAGPMAVILVGALFVAGIEMVWSGLVTPPTRARVRRWDYEDGPQLARGAELGRFNMGSTVIVLFPPGAMAWEPHHGPTDAVQMGELLGRMLR